MKVTKLLGRWSAVCGLLAAGLFLAGCHLGGDKFAELPDVSSAPAVVGSPTAAQVSAPASATLDKLNAGDLLNITFSDLPTPQLPLEQRIKDDGSITLLLNQTFKAAGKTRGELEKEIRDRYVPRYYINMTVSVVQQKETQFYFVGGEVKQPARQVYISRITVLKAIQSAGDFTDFAKRSKVVLTRANGRTVTIDCGKAQHNPTLDLEVYPGDKIWVPRRILF
ncbi:MAG TPA: polysaccharide biosynthesis/export family protein [Candidatus Sulfotelmatobacter sp.]|nr:polysaccharide biosynthesis/export family protein [Candidatus Sulfotelmatobacter sp.]